MCVIICGEWGTPLPTLEELRAWQEWNPHGYGWAWVRADGTVRTGRGLGKVKIPHELRRGLETTWMFHARLATGGTISRENTHPFKVGDGALAHNGVMSHLKWAHGWSDWSDTRTVATWLHHVVHQKAKRKHEAVTKAIHRIVGRDRIAWLTPKGFVRAGPGWVERNGRWYTTERDPLAPPAKVEPLRSWSGGDLLRWLLWRQEREDRQGGDEPLVMEEHSRVEREREVADAVREQALADWDDWTK